MRTTFAEINLKNLQHNFLQIKKIARNKKILAVVKADAYGHGMIKCAEALLKLKEKAPDYFGVALTEEGIELRKSGLTEKPILLFSPFDKNEVSDYLRFDLIPTVSSEEHIKVLSKLKLRKKLKIHINVDTGMGRLGLGFEDAVENIKKISSIKNIFIDGIYTHFACADENDSMFTMLQTERFKSIINNLNKENISFGTAHAANSAAIIKYPESHFDMVRPGISLYGYPPAQELSDKISLKPVMSLITNVSTLRKVKAGDSVSYGRLFFAKRDSIIGSLPIGYADGLNRNLTNSINVIIKDDFFPQVGRVTMDRIMFDTLGKKINTGDKVILLGSSKSNKIDAWDWSNILKTIPYEITCGIGKRVPRVYK
jgi:alanine racemase